MSTQTIITLPKAEDVINDINRIFDLQKVHQYEVAKSTASERKAKIKKIHNAMLTYRTELHEAMNKDFRRNSAETDLQDIFAVTGEAKHTASHLKSWMKPKKVSTPMALIGSQSYIHQEPKGVVLIISPWNFPINLTFSPLISAVAAGNCVIVKPSEMTPNTSAVIVKIIRDIFDEKEVAIFEGGADVSTELLKKPFNHIFFTGSPQIGKVVMRAASDYLASVTLELGGKSPTIIDKTANLEEAAAKVAWAKFSNNGQICIAPDYVFVHESKKERFVYLLKQRIEKMYGKTSEERKGSDSYCRIVNNRHFNRVKGLLDDAVEHGAKIEIGGNHDGEENYIEPTVLTNVSFDSRIMQEEIFGPILPIHTFSDISEPISYINKGEKPLALYVYARGGNNAKRVINETRAGGSCINDCNIHFGNQNLPFGGSNNSGIGMSHGIFGFQEFSHQRAVLKQPTTLSAVKSMMPPYNDTVKKMVEMTIKWF